MSSHPLPRVALAGALCLVLAATAHAAPHATAPEPWVQPAYASAVLVEAQSGTVLFAHEPYLQRSPASTLKLLLELVVIDELASGRHRLDEEVQVSRRAARVGGSQVFLREGELFTLGQLMEAIVVASANDACVAVAEHLAGSAEAFAETMNAKARALGLEHTRCVNVHGLDDTPPGSGNVTTAYDLAQIARVLVRHPQIIEWSSTVEKPFREGKFTLHTTNKLLGRYEGLDGLKTGYTGRAGFCLVATAKRDDMRLIAVVMGTPSDRVRAREVSRLLDWGFANFTRVPLAAPGQPLGTVAVSWGCESEVRAVVPDGACVVLRPEQERQLSRRLELPGKTPAPIAAGQPLGRLAVSLGDSTIAVFPLVAEKAVARATLWEKLTSWF